MKRRRQPGSDPAAKPAASPASEAPFLVLVGGFLGAGKTTLILRAAGLLRQRGLRVAVITNDQDAGLVDTRFTQAGGLPTSEVAGGCFCCRFSDLLDAAAALQRFHPQVIFAEPVGSCVDLAATILQPLLADHRATFRVAPLTVLVDPALADAFFSGRADGDVAFLFRNQLAEADLLCLTKADRPMAEPELPVPIDHRVSAVTGLGLERWLDDVLSGSRVPGTRILDIDYARYAAAEAALGWVNLHAEIRLKRPLSPAMLAGPLLDTIDTQLTEAGIRIAHLKLFDRCAAGYVKASLCANGEEPQPEGDLAASADRLHELVINLRAAGEPGVLDAAVRHALSQFEGDISIRHAGAFRPAPPRPEHRLGAASTSPSPRPAHE